LSTGSLRDPETQPGRGDWGFTLLELMVVLVISGLMMGAVALTFNGYVSRTRAQRAAQVFAQDLALARSTAVRTRQKVVIHFDETNRLYNVQNQDTTFTVVRRRFGTNADIDLTAIDLNTTGDSLVFSSRGIADLSGAGSTLGTATFTSGDVVFTVSFNSLGASKVE